MRMLAVALAAPLVIVCASATVGLENELRAPDETAMKGVEISREARLDELFRTLLSAQDEKTAKAAENGIIELWNESGSDTVDLLMKWTIEAIDAENYPLALDFLDRITSLKPDYAEGWNKRATVYFLTEDYAKSIADIERVLALEPRHFGALSGLGTILREIGEKKWAAEAYQRALTVDPHLDNVRKALDELGEEGVGRAI